MWRVPVRCHGLEESADARVGSVKWQRRIMRIFYILGEVHDGVLSVSRSPESEFTEAVKCCAEASFRSARKCTCSQYKESRQNPRKEI